MDRSELWNTVGSIDSVYCGSGVDGKGLRCVVFFSGCNLRCPFCHNPETLFKGGEQIRAGELAERLMKYKPYFRRGGVTLSGGEPFLQKKFLLSLVDLLHAQGIHVLAETNGQIADGEILSVFFRSLACYYADTVKQIEKITGEKVTGISIVGGGSRNDYLNELTAQLTGCSVCAGPVEAAAVGNLICQMIATEEISGKIAARQMCKESFDIKTYN